MGQVEYSLQICDTKDQENLLQYFLQFSRSGFWFHILSQHFFSLQLIRLCDESNLQALVDHVGKNTKMSWLKISGPGNQEHLEEHNEA